MKTPQIGFVGLLAAGLTIAFVVLKTTGIIAWPWWLVFAPAWGYGALVMIVMAVLIAFIAIAASGTPTRRK